MTDSNNGKSSYVIIMIVFFEWKISFDFFIGNSCKNSEKSLVLASYFAEKKNILSILFVTALTVVVIKVKYFCREVEP